MASYGFGRKEQISSRIYHRPTHSRNSLSIDRFCGCVLQRQRPSVDSDRRSFAIATGYLAGIWTHQTSSSQKRQRQTQVSSPQTACGFAGRRCKESSGQPRQFVEGIDQSVVWQKERNRKAYSRDGHWSEDQYLSYGTAQWHDKRPAGSSEPAYSQRLSSARDVAVLDMAVAGFVQLDKGALLAAGRNACDGVGSCKESVGCSGLCFVSGSCQRPSTLGLGRAA